MSEPLALLATAGLGLIAGSFLNVVIHRLPRGGSLVRPPSACPYCRGRVRSRDNVPVLSYLILRGRCRHCAAPISGRYPLVEAATALLFALCVLRFGLTPAAGVAALFCALLLALAMIDAEHFLLPDKITLPGVALGLALQSWFPETYFLDAVLGVLCGAGALILIINVWFWLRSEEGMGLGDVNMLALIGAFLGWQGAALTLAAAAFLGALLGIILMAFGRLGMKSRLPFGVFLAGGALIALFAGPQILEFYSGLL